jgi:hypothetical protein
MIHQQDFSAQRAKLKTAGNPRVRELQMRDNSMLTSTGQFTKDSINNMGLTETTTAG